MVNLLFVASEAFPLVKTGGLADVAASLPEALRQKGMNVRLLLPAYGDLLAGLQGQFKKVAEFQLAGQSVRILETRLPGTALITWLLDHPMFSARSGNPYHDEEGVEWPDNADRFILLCRAAAKISTEDTVLKWRPDVLHCNDWHTAPAIALTHMSEQRPRTVFTIHNLAHMGIFDRATFDRMQLPEQFWQEHGFEYYQQCSFIKGGLVFADMITTVSPTYAEEICHSPGGMGLEGLLAQRQDRLLGILNGIDATIWNPASDAYLEYCYDRDSLDKKALNKTALQVALGLEARTDCPLLGFVGRLVEQKGLELILPVLEQVLATPVQLVVLGKGNPVYERELQAIAGKHTDSMAVVLTYNESLAHRIEAAADIFLMPSLFEPCGLNQLYSLRYGTLPLVRAVGGLADTVVNSSGQTRGDATANGFVFQQPNPAELLATVQRAVDCWHQKPVWQQMQHYAMGQDFSWQQSADRYLELYRSLID